MDDNVGRRSPRSLSPERRASTLPRSDRSRDPAGEEFLFHLFRGSELLQDSRVHEAKEELEQALQLQPRDPKGQDLLAVVYFRIGHYPRAIQIYEQLKHDHPGRTSLSLNLALCYLKTGQAQRAREELEEVVTVSPEHRRAWGYLGLAYERLGDYDKAELAFERGGHTAMARRMTERRGGRPSIVSSDLAPLSRDLEEVREGREAPDSGGPRDANGAQTAPSARAAHVASIPQASRSSQASQATQVSQARQATNTTAIPNGASEGREAELPFAAAHEAREGEPPFARLVPETSEVRAAAEPFEELDSGELSFVLAQAETHRPEPEMWHPVEIGEAIKLPSDAPRSAPLSAAPPFAHTPHPRAISGSPAANAHVPVSAPAPAHAPRSPAAPVALQHLLRAARVTPAPDEALSTTAAGQIVVHLRSPGMHRESRNVALRFDALRSYTGSLTTQVLERRGRGHGDSFGGISSTVVHATGNGVVVLSPRPGRSAVASALGEDDVLFLREDAILAFDLSMTFENGRLARGDDEPIFVVHLRGPGPLAIEYIEPLATLEVTPDQAATVRAPSVLGWTGHLVPTAVPPGEAPGGQRGLINFVGAGTVLVAGR
ncbi:tetratricopeptide repeat protein [Pendulispora albinea]|uniref:Tetratricopeptide repeat protein n=1 Tax=Pendulispora albinea TaxID=2741071 RepID=A0ABZ2M9U8_9BACT